MVCFKFLICVRLKFWLTAFSKLTSGSSSSIASVKLSLRVFLLVCVLRLVVVVLIYFLLIVFYKLSLMVF